MKGNLRMMKDAEKESSNGKMEKNIEGSGKMVSSME